MKLVLFKTCNKDSQGKILEKAINPESVAVVDPYSDAMCRIYFYSGKDTVVLGAFDEVVAKLQGE